MDRDDLKSVIEWLIQNKFLYRRDGRYPVLHIAYNGNHYKEVITTAMLKKLVNYINKSKDR